VPEPFVVKLGVWVALLQWFTNWRAFKVITVKILFYKLLAPLPFIEWI